MGNCCHSTKPISATQQEHKTENKEKTTIKIQEQHEQQQEVIINPPMSSKNENVIRASSLRNQEEEKKEEKIPEKTKKEEIFEIKNQISENKINVIEPAPDTKIQSILRPSDISNFNIIKPENNNQIFENFPIQPKIKEFDNENDGLSNEFSIFENRMSFADRNRLSIINRGSDRKKQYILTDNCDEEDEDNLLYKLEKMLFELRNEFLERKSVRKYFALFFEKNFLYDNFYDQIKGIKNDIQDLIIRLFQLHNIKYTEILDNKTLKFENYKIECQALSESDLDFFLPIFFFEFSLYPISFIRNSKLSNLYFTNSLNFINEKVNEYRPIVPNYKDLSIVYCCKERNISYIKSVMHHEFFHFIYSVDDHKSLNEENWEQLNLEGFEYGGNEGQLSGKKGFLNYCSTQDIEEDKAEIFSHMFNFPIEAFEASDRIILKKVMYHVSFFEKFDPRGVGGENFWVILRELRKKLENQFINKV